MAHLPADQKRRGRRVAAKALEGDRKSHQSENGQKKARHNEIIYAAAATWGTAGGASTLGSSITGASVVGAGTASASAAGFSRGATGAGSSIIGGASASATLAGTEGSRCLGLKKSPTRADKRRPILGDLGGLSSFFSSFCAQSDVNSIDISLLKYHIPFPQLEPQQTQSR